MHPRYRPDIDGLRALAVMAVILFHAFPKVVPGGFVGVDIFFVISGYLITQIIQGDLENGRFNAGQFYARRIRRIFPALIIVLIVAFALGWRFLAPAEFTSLGKKYLRFCAIFSQPHGCCRKPAISIYRRISSHSCICGRSASKSNSIWFGRGRFG
jgi:peptidoglycan/LPS O-acetylase OafA/YrhL